MKNWWKYKPVHRQVKIVEAEIATLQKQIEEWEPWDCLRERINKQYDLQYLQRYLDWISKSLPDEKDVGMKGVEKAFAILGGEE